MKNPFFYVLLAVLVVLDGWLMSHPNLLGRAGIFFYDYNYLKTFPRALGTVAAVVGVSILLTALIGRATKTIAVLLLAVLLSASGYWLFISAIQFNEGVYKLTGAGFRAGAILLPGLIMLVVGKTLFDRISKRS
ncbi:hypothetical protein [Fibrivirga algicola]|uniref:DUF4293 family protein n=1 Tax=Fibrivirga algicola TaxID=2950420 RepID=A0ABX0QLY1_9BACT|nr:hypothetical protein [Fibrivirga algicola]ARK09952.1 hypothetical protein A6C57_06140 [Fibrella sp. ES10-3-2-2]NID11613.1 hypothetical protein [Fibrivirga algicola]